MQLISITSEALQATIRRLLPSQAGFSEDLQAQNVITPIIDLTPTAEGSQLPPELQQAINFGNASALSVTATTTAAANTPGFYRLIGAFTQIYTNGIPSSANISMTNLLSSKVLWGVGDQLTTSGQETTTTTSVDLIFFLDTNDVLNIGCGGSSQFVGSIRTIADRYGALSNPSGFTFE